MTDTIFAEGIVARFRSGYPESPMGLSHRLLGHPLLELDSIASLAQRIARSEIEYNSGDLPLGISADATPGNGLSVEQTIRTIEENGSWMVLKRVEQDRAYSDLLQEALAELKPSIEAVTGPMLQLEGFIFVSSPNAVTPLHFDPEYNILCQIRGSKVMTIFPAGDEEIAPRDFHENYHRGGPRNLEWRDTFEPRGTAFSLTPADAVYVPLMAPHWVQNGPEVSISFSITWRSRWSFHQADAHAFNRRLRNLGLRPERPRPFPKSNLLKSVAHRALRKAEQAVRAARP